MASLGPLLTISLEEVLQVHQTQHGVPKVLPVQSLRTLLSVLLAEGHCEA